MKKIKIQYGTMFEKLANENLPEDGKGISKKWLGVFNEDDFKKIITYKRDMLLDLDKIPNNPALTEEVRMNILMEIDNPVLTTDQPKIKLIAGSFENFYYLREYIGMMKKFKDKPYLKPIETSEDFFKLILQANKSLGKDLVNKLFFNDFRDHNKK